MADLYVVEFKGSRREYYYNTYYHALKIDDLVIVQAEQGEHIGTLSKKIEKEVDFSDTTRPRSVLRRAGEADTDRYRDLQSREVQYKGEIIELVAKHGLPMKIVDVECQFDGNKITFYFTADHRVDFRALVRDLAAKYRTRIELRQIGVRDEARRVGGYGICGREQCCNSFIRDFAPISTQHAREQDLTLNPSKISGNCGRLLCCLRYEVDMYTQCKKKFPKPGTVVESTKGTGVIDQIDIFNEVAVVKEANGAFFHVCPHEIKSVRTDAAAKPVAFQPRGAAYAKEQPVDAQDEAALKKLDEPEE